LFVSPASIFRFKFTADFSKLIVPSYNPQKLKGGITMSDQKIHVVQSGETLSSIAKQYYDDANEYTAIYEANKDKLSSPDNIQVGQELVIPMAGASGGVRSN
jgi:nucleoid-associated protein YgaU